MSKFTMKRTWKLFGKDQNTSIFPISSRSEKKFFYRFGVFYTTWYVEPTPYLQWSTQQFLNNGGKLKKQFIHDISEISSQYDIIVNCTGLGSRKLFNDHKIYPVRGQIMRVSCPSVKHFLIDDDCYALLK